MTSKSILSLYFSKENIGLTHFSKSSYTMECAIIQHYIHASRAVIKDLIESRNVDLLLTNNENHAYVKPFAQSILIAKVDERGL